MSDELESFLSNICGNLTPSDRESDLAASHRESIESCLRTNFTLGRYFRSGSFGSGTSVRGHSDVDYFAEIKNFHGLHGLPALRQVRTALVRRFPSTKIVIDAPAVICKFGSDDWETTEIIPARRVNEWDDPRVFEIPFPSLGNSTGWILSAPEAHAEYLAGGSEAFKRYARNMTRLIKAWNFTRNIGLRSFYLEMVVAEFVNKRATGYMPVDLAKLFRELRSQRCSPIQDPIGLAGEIKAVAGSVSDQIVNRLIGANNISSEALNVYLKGDLRAAVGRYRMLLGQFVPSWERLYGRT